MRRILPGLLGLLVACSGASDKGGPGDVAEAGDSGPCSYDGDGDAYEAYCDTDPCDGQYDGGEDCDGLDNDCDGEVDEGVTETFYQDTDGDGYGDPAVSADACEGWGGWVEDATDCDDTNPDVNPGAAEVCDGLDQDCDEAADEGVC